MLKFVHEMTSLLNEMNDMINVELLDSVKKGMVDFGFETGLW